MSDKGAAIGDEKVTAVALGWTQMANGMSFRDLQCAPANAPMPSDGDIDGAEPRSLSSMPLNELAEPVCTCPPASMLARIRTRAGVPEEWALSNAVGIDDANMRHSWP